MRSNLNHLWAELIVEELVRNGADCFCLASGSRCAPTAMAAAVHQGARLVTHCDERSTAFFALGHARATGRPAVWVTTSGTAVANGMPAVIEAAQDRIPLILLTADRPPELRECGANQTIDQVKLFGAYVRWQFDLPCPDTAVPPTMVLTTADQAVYRATRSPAGPVHLNCMFREPLAPEPDGGTYEDYLAPLQDWRSGGDPFTRYASSVNVADGETLRTVFDGAAQATRGVVVVGKLNGPAEQEAVRDMLADVAWPVLPDVTSGFRTGSELQHAIPYYDQILLSESMRGRLKPDFIWTIGGAVVSKRLQTFVRDSKAACVVMKNHPSRQDPFHAATHSVETDLPSAAQWMKAGGIKLERSDTLSVWREAGARVDAELTRLFTANGPADEPSVARAVSTLIPRQHGLFLAGSMPIRDMDMFAKPGEGTAIVAANRGASGIDGTVSTAAGFASGLDAPVTLLIGDLALLHDLSALRLLNQLDLHMIVIVLNNNGGGIFSFLPVADHPDTFETCFGTPHDLTFENAARMFDLDYINPETRASFEEAYGIALQEKASCLIEVITNRIENFDLHRSLQQAVRERLERTG